MAHQDHGPTFRSDLLRDAVITLAAAVVAVLALDDITTDTASSFAFERAALAGCASWFAIMAVRLVRQGRRILGGVSLGVIAAAALSQGAIGPGTVPSMRFEYLATIIGVAWFVVVAAILARCAWPSDRGSAFGPE